MGSINIPLGGGKYVPIYAEPSGWQYSTSSYIPATAGVGPSAGLKAGPSISAGPCAGTLVVWDTQGRFKREQKYRLGFIGTERSFSLSIGVNVLGGQVSTEQMPSGPYGQIYRLPKTGAVASDSGQPFAATQEAGSPTGFAGAFMLGSFGGGIGVNKSQCVMFLGGPPGAGRSWNQTDFITYKYVTFFWGISGGASVGLGYTVATGEVSEPRRV
jgi:hypothetical protein